MKRWLTEFLSQQMTFKIQLCNFTKDYEGFCFEIFSVDNYGDFDRSLFLIGKRYDTWFLELFFLRIAPR